MPDKSLGLEKIGLIGELVRRAPNPPGRTAIMKYLYFLKVLRNVPLPYKFRLYTYGPFDSDVLDDLRSAEAMGAVQGEIVTYPGGRGYTYEPGPQIEELREDARPFLRRHEESIDWVLSTFGNRSASDLEMASTLVFVDRWEAEKRTKQEITELARKVRAIKPYLAATAIEREAQALSERGLLEAVA